MSIPFVRGRPNGRRALAEISRPQETEAKAKLFLSRNGRYLCEILKSGQPHLFALIDIDGEPTQVAGVVCDNDGEVLGAVDWLVEESLKYIPALPQPVVHIPLPGQA